MGTKLRPGNFDCYANALPDEPMFILLARDPSAPSKVRAWAYDREKAIGHGNRPTADTPMVAEARQCADDMEAWRRANDGAWRNPRPTVSDDTVTLRADIAAAREEIGRLQRSNGALARCLLPVHMTLAERELVDDPVPDDAVVLCFMGSGASDNVTAGMIRAALAGGAPDASDH